MEAVEIYVLLLVPCCDLNAKKLISYAGPKQKSPSSSDPVQMAYLNNIRPYISGLVAFDAELRLYRFLRPVNNRWRVDHFMADAIRNGSRRFYGYEDLFAVVDDNGRIERFSHITDQNLQLSVADPSIGGSGLPVGFIRPLGPGIDPAEQDRLFREDRDRRLVIAAPPPGDPPVPPAAGAALAAGAESQHREVAEGQPAVAAAALAVWPAEAVAWPRVLVETDPEQNHNAAVAALLALSGWDAPPPAVDETFENDLSDDARLLLDLVRANIGAPARPPPVRTRWPSLAVWDHIPNILTPRAADMPRAMGAAPKPLSHVSEAVIEKAIREKQSCPISMEELTKENATCVAPCYHTFEKEAIQTWVQGHGTCPTCRQTCCL